MTTYFVNCLKIDGVVYKLSNESDNCIDEIRQYTYSYMTNTYEYVQDAYSYLSNFSGAFSENINESINNAYSYLENSISYISGQVTNSTTYTSEQLSELSSNLEGLGNTLSSYVTKDELSSCSYISEHQSLEDYVTEVEFDNIIKNTSDEFDSKIEENSRYIYQRLENYVTIDELSSYNYLTEHQSLEGYASESYVISKINEAVLAGSDNEINLDVYALKTEIPNVDNFVTRNELSSYNYLTEHQSLADYATKDMLNSYVSKNLLESCGYISQHQSLVGYATEEWVTTQINNASISGGNNNINLSIYVTKDELNSCGYLTAHQPLDGYVSKLELSSCGYLTEHQPLDSYVSKLELSSCGYITSIPDLGSYVSKVELSNCGYITSTSLNGYATESYVMTQIANASLGGGENNIDLTDYVSKTELDACSYITSESIQIPILSLVWDEELEEEQEEIVNTSVENILENAGILSNAGDGYEILNTWDQILEGMKLPLGSNESEDDNSTDIMEILIEAGILEKHLSNQGEWSYYTINRIPTGE